MPMIRNIGKIVRGIRFRKSKSQFRAMEARNAPTPAQGHGINIPKTIGAPGNKGELQGK